MAVHGWLCWDTGGGNYVARHLAASQTLVRAPCMCRGEELAAPYYAFKAKGYNVTIASIKGGEVGTVFMH